MSKCTFTGHKTLENIHKPLVLKELRKLWNKEEPDLPWEQGYYSPSNTLLVDDSPYKALRNPVLALFSFTYHFIWTIYLPYWFFFHVCVLQPYTTAIFPQPYSYLNSNDNSLGIWSFHICRCLIFRSNTSYSRCELQCRARWRSSCLSGEPHSCRRCRVLRSQQSIWPTFHHTEWSTLELLCPNS